jgi:hypothetical protein
MNYSGSDHAAQNAKAELARDQHEKSKSWKCWRRGLNIAKSRKKKAEKERRRAAFHERKRLAGALRAEPWKLEAQRWKSSEKLVGILR